MSNKCKVNFKILSLVVFFFISCATPVFSEIVFEENFDSVADWSASETGSDYTLYFDDGDTLPATSSTTYPRWTALGIHRGGVPDSTLERSITPSAARGGTGKGLLYRIEKDGNWRGGRMIMGLDRVYDEIYVRFYAKYQDGFDWGGSVGHAQQKMLEVSTWPSTLARNGTNGYVSRGSAYWLQPNPIIDWYHNASFGTTRIEVFERGASPAYTALAETILSAANFPGDGWHCYEFRFKMNSSPGVADGEWQVWMNGTSVGLSSSVNWVDSAPWVTGASYAATMPTAIVIPDNSRLVGFRSLSSHTAGGTEPVWSNATVDGDIVSDGNGNQWEMFSYGWNRANFGDNGYFGAYTDTNEIEEDMYFDDIVISTHYSGPPPSPLSVSAQRINDTDVKINWAPGSNGAVYLLDGYQIHYGTTATVLDQIVDVGKVTQWELKNLLPGQAYFFSVTAYNQASYDVNRNEGAFSKVTTTLEPAQNLRIVPQN